LLLYLALPVDLRDRYPTCQWLVYGKMVEETEFVPGDILVIAEWVIPDRTDLLRVMYRARQEGARVIYVGPTESETEDFERQLCLMGLFDYLFFTDEIILGRIDYLIEHPRNPSDVPLFQEVTDRVLGEMPPVVDVFDDEGERSLPEDAPGDERDGTPWLRQVWQRMESRKRPKEEGTEHQSTPIPPQTRRIVWPNLEPVHVRISGVHGVGKTLLAWQLACLCQARELPAAIIEDDIHPLVTWVDGAFRSHVYHTWPKKGYRVLLDTRKTKDMSDADLVIAVCFPERSSYEQVCLELESSMIPQSQVIWVVNQCSAGVAFPIKEAALSLPVPYEPRHFSGIRMHKPLVELDVGFATLFSQVVDEIANQFSQRIDSIEKGGEPEHVAALGL